MEILNDEIKSKKFLKWSLISIGAIFFMGLVVLISFYFAFENNYKDHIYPGLFLGQIDLSGKTYNQAGYILEDQFNKLSEEGIEFSYKNKKDNLFPIVPASEGDSAIGLITFDTEKTLDQFLQYGRTGNFFTNTKAKWISYFEHQKLNLLYTLNEDKIKKHLEDKFSNLNDAPENAKLTHKKPGTNEAYAFEIVPEKYGQGIDFKKGLEDLKNDLDNFSFTPISLAEGSKNPEILKKDCINVDSKAEKFLSQAPLTLKNKDKKWVIDKNLIADWLALKLNPDTKSQEDKILVEPDFKLIEDWLTNDLAKKIDVAPEDPRFEMKNGKVETWKTAKDGLALDVVKAYLAIEESLKGGEKEIELVVNEIKSELNPEGVTDLGIKELLGTGYSNFSGSPKNRRHNIRTGADAVNGVLIKPDAEFSLIKTLGRIDKSSGYLPELVIKDNKTTPEYGGGLCQIGTTVFRATTKSGLPVTMRYNHSYRVGYYEPAGTDATIYDPFPDYRFVNDTKSYVLIQARIEGNNLYFDFWGTKDGRAASATYPVIYGIVKPKPTKIVETLDLKPGVKKCTEHAHNGANAYFDYTITYSRDNPPIDLRDKADIADKDLVRKKRFNSHYVPWQEVCLVGVEKLATDLDKKKAASSTAEKVN